MAPKDITDEKNAPCSDPNGRSEPPKAAAKKSLPSLCLDLLLKTDIPEGNSVKADYLC